MNTKVKNSSEAASAKETAESQRHSRLAASLRANLQKRKEQSLRRNKKPDNTNKS
tara:strand:+ start:305 stop:469 length:165 start_codon:yes stop_codon:yes gene_type:complete